MTSEETDGSPGGEGGPGSEGGMDVAALGKKQSITSHTGLPMEGRMEDDHGPSSSIGSITATILEGCGASGEKYDGSNDGGRTGSGLGDGECCGTSTGVEGDRGCGKGRAVCVWEG